MSEIQIFNNPDFGEIRTVIIDGEPWFVGRDLATALGYVKPETAIRNNVDKGDTLKQGISDSNNHTQQMLVINEAGMYALIFGSKLESAKKFKKWVTSEVLPSIRKTGQYGQKHLPSDPMQLLELHYQALRQVDSKVNALSDSLSTVRQDLEQFKDDLPLLGIEESRITRAVKKKGVECLGGKQAPAYKDKSLRARLYCDMHQQLRREFDVSSYKAIRRSQADTAVSIIQRYTPPLAMADTIRTVNAQQTMEV